MNKKKSNVKHSWVIGASSGIGAALAKKLTAEGHVVAISARRIEKLNQIKKSLANANAGNIAVEMDVTSKESIKQATSEVFKNFSKVDEVFFMPAFYEPGKIDKFSPDSVEKAIKTNLTSAFYILYELLPYLRKQTYSQILFCSSVAGYVGLPNAQPYSATKAALTSLAETLRVDLAPKIDVRVISPGFVKTELTDKNDFNMPFIIDADEAARVIFKQLYKKNFEIHFPKRLTLLLKFMRLLPYSLVFKLLKSLKNFPAH